MELKKGSTSKQPTDSKKGESRHQPHHPFDGAQAAMRVIVENVGQGQVVSPVGRGTIRIELVDPKHGPK